MSEGADDEDEGGAGGAGQGGAQNAGGAGGAGQVRNVPPIDLSAIKPPPPAGGTLPLTDGKGTPVAVSPPTIIDETRKKIAYFLLSLLTVVIVFQVLFGSIYSVGCWYNQSADKCELASKSLGLMSSSLTSIFTAMVGLVGSVVGFYFGSKKD